MTMLRVEWHLNSNNPPAKPGALIDEPLKAADRTPRFLWLLIPSLLTTNGTAPSSALKTSQCIAILLSTQPLRLKFHDQSDTIQTQCVQGYLTKDLGRLP